MNVRADPTQALPHALHTFLDSLAESDHEALVVRLDECSDHIADAILDFVSKTSVDAEAAFAREWMPVSVLAHVASTSVAELVDAVNAVDLRWRLDAVTVILDYVSPTGPLD